MAIPFEPVGIGQVAAKNVFKITFSEDLSVIPELHAWDDFNLNTVANKVFTGTTVNSSKSMIGAVGLNVAPGASWWPGSAVAGAAVNNASRLIGNTGYCKLAASAPSAGDVFFNFDYSFPDDVLPSDSMSFVFNFLYVFTGATPTITISGNDGGTEGTPVWTALTTQPGGTNGTATVLRPSDTGGSGSGDTVTIPTSGEEFPDEIWLTAAA
ncbi:hypothetical protein LCGC14_2475890 [marine sediment metagenome]|uniref:Uncharacterized protein n=1 Tax=marine sediment metagenome TaxID=412755 RepID=A0A0F9BWX0_9ZZZZ